MATPPSASRHLLRESAPDLASKIADIKQTAIDTRAVIVNKDQVVLHPVAGLFAQSSPFYSMVSRDTVHNPHYRGFTFHFKPDQLNDDDKRQCMEQVLNLTQDQWLGQVNKTNRLPILKTGHVDWTADLDQLLQQSALPLAITGNYFQGLSVEDCVLRSLKEYRRVFTTARTTGSAARR